MKPRYDVKANISECEFCGNPMKPTGPPINEEYCPNDECTPLYVAQFEKGVREMIKRNEEERIKAVQKIVGSRAKAIKVLNTLKAMI